MTAHGAVPFAHVMELQVFGNNGCSTWAVIPHLRNGTLAGDAGNGLSFHLLQPLAVLFIICTVFWFHLLHSMNILNGAVSKQQIGYGFELLGLSIQLLL